MNYQQTLDFLFVRLPVFQRIGAAAYKDSLDNTLCLMHHLNNPYQHYRTIHIAGTNGKGSVSHNIASILKENGFKVGLYTSPHLKDFRERITIDGKMCEKDFVIDFVEQNRNIISKLQPSFFELTCAMAFKYFEHRVDIAVIEVGMGGRLDSTNVITPLLSVITNISFDHTQFLGDTLPKIATEKAGIIKHSIPAVIGQSNEEYDTVFINRAAAENAPLFFADRELRVIDYKNENSNGNDYKKIKVAKDNETLTVETPLLGDYQLKNILTVLSAVNHLPASLNISRTSILNGIKNLQKNFPLSGRWQVLNKEPYIVADTAHNEDGLRQTLAQLRQMQQAGQTAETKLHFVLTFVNDKDVAHILPLFPKDAQYYISKADIPRGMEIDVLEQHFKTFDLEYEKFASIKQALETAKQRASKTDIIYIGGSTFTLSEISLCE